MSLQVWLPLNGDLHNQGLNNIQPVGNGVALDTNGKIGSCYSFNGSNSISINSVILPSQTPNWSFACWFLLTDTSLTSANCLFSERTGTVSTGYTIFIYPKTGKILVDDGTRWEVTPMVFSQNIWYHLVITRSPSGKKLYINGQLKNSTSTIGNATTINTNGCLIGLAQSSTSLLTGNQGIVGKLNDIRIYDHALSEKEVEKIAKGLVLHYKLNNNGMGNENLVNSSITWTELNTKANFNTILTSTTNFGLLVGENFTFSVDIKVPTTIKKARARVQFYNSSSDRTGPTGTTYITDGEGRIYVSGTVLANYSRMELLIDWNASSDITTTNVPCYYKNIKLERGTNATVWCPYDNSNIVYDSSGYNNNGIIVGSLETTTPSPKYSCTTFFDNKEYIIHKLPENMYQATYSFWVKASSYTGYGAVYMPYQSPSAGTSPWFAINTESCKVWAYFGNNSPNYTKGSGTMPLNEWHHCVYVWNNGVAQWYVDGEKNGNSVTYTGRTFIQNTANATIGNSFTGTNWNGTPFAGEISDFRVYATALTEAQIKELYKTSMIVNSTSVTARDLE